jgi:hypothetical protein
MQHLLETAENTMEELETMKNRGYCTMTRDRCDLCYEGLLGNQYYLFPCSHVFHSACLLREVHKTLSSSQLTALRAVEDSLKALSHRVKDSDSRARTQQEALQQELDGYIASDCPLCGFAMINSLATSLVSDEEKNAAKLWIL